MALNLGLNYPSVAKEAGFKIRKYNEEPMDWHILGSIGIDQILEEQDLHKIDNILHHLSETSLGSVMDTNALEYGIAKYILVSQFAIQYLLFCRTYLEDSLMNTKDTQSETQIEIGRLRKSLANSKQEVEVLDKKLADLGKPSEESPVEVHSCSSCSKSFISNEFLNSHISRRHPGSASRSANSENLSECSTLSGSEKERDLSLINTIKLQLEIKQLKERLKATEMGIKNRSVKNAPAKRDVGVQIDLLDRKALDNRSLAAINSETLKQLSQKVYEFDLWRDKLRTDYDKFIKEINIKFEHLARALIEENPGSNLEPPSVQNHISNSCMEQLETILIEKIAEIGVLSAKKLEEVVGKMEDNYKYKLYELEQEIKNRDIEILKKIDSNSNTNVSTNEVSNRISSDTFNVTDSESLLEKPPKSPTPPNSN